MCTSYIFINSVTSEKKKKKTVEQCLLVCSMYFPIKCEFHENNNGWKILERDNRNKTSSLEHKNNNEEMNFPRETTERFSKKLKK